MSAPIRVLQVFARMDRGGAETMIMNLYRNIDRSKIQFDFIVHYENECDYDEEIKLLGGNIYRIPRYTGKNHCHYIKAWSKFLKEHSEYKIIHGHVRSTASIYLKIAKKYGLITIVHSHSTSSGKGFSAIVKNILQYPIRYTADYLFACSRNAGLWLFGNRACNKENFIVFNNAIDTNEFIFDKDARLEKRKEFQIVEKFVIGHVGRFITPKNHVFLIDLFKAVYDKNDKAVLILIGEGELRQLIEKQVYDLGLNDNVIFTGMRPDVNKVLQGIDVFVFPSIYEGLPVTLVEAQAAGLPCITSDRITNEVKITDLIEYISLNQSAEYWADKILGYSYGYERRITYDEITKAGYDIVSVTKKYENFYLTC